MEYVLKTGPSSYLLPHSLEFFVLLSCSSLCRSRQQLIYSFNQFSPLEIKATNPCQVLLKVIQEKQVKSQARQWPTFNYHKYNDQQNQLHNVHYFQSQNKSCYDHNLGDLYWWTCTALASYNQNTFLRQEVSKDRKEK